MGKTLLIVEDEVDLREPLVSEFEHLGCKVFQASNGVKAFEIVSQESVDLVISDIRMPGGDGIELLKKIRERTQDVPVVMLITGFSDISLEESYELGAEAVLSKPFDLDEIEETVGRLLTPPEQRWANEARHSSVTRHVEKTFESLEMAEASGSFALGRGGFFVDTPDVRAGRPLSFYIKFESGDLLLLEGTGTARWVRPLDGEDFKAGCGIEFASLSDATRADVVRLTQALLRTAFLPRALS